ncbi:MAG: nucleotide exchange factor GrpE [Deltaproteobacteria bacterium]|uniref:Protein GrpE n=1 Tax=Candidatus Zymogenus saltonus TaxID=2844893 RepID=A0A9D8KE93_9DELT|nr:nucleotide exchange factor GrpE [Candidatus Zymogenus saltonus]
MDEREKKGAQVEGGEEIDNEIPKEDIDEALKEAEDISGDRSMKAEGDSGEGYEGRDDKRGVDEGMEGEGGEDGSSEVGVVREELENAKREASEKHDQYLRVLAEFENFKKRVQKESAESRRYANEELLKAMLPVIDNLERALEHGGNDAKDDPMVEGIKMVQKQFLETLTKFGVSQVEALGEPFDPNFHEAMMQIATNDSPPNTVVTEIAKGYLFNDRLIRPAMVGVSVAAGNADAQGLSSDEDDKAEGEDTGKEGADDMKEDGEGLD